MIPSFLFALMAHAEPVVGPADPVEMRALAVHVYLDRSASYKKLDKSANDKKHAAQDLALVEDLAKGLQPQDLFSVTAFDGVTYPLLPLDHPPSAEVIERALQGVHYDGAVTFYTSVLNDVVAHRSAAGTTDIAVIVTDADGSDPTNARKGKARPAVADPTWADAPVAFLGDVRVLWVIRGKDPETVAPGAVKGPITEPSGLTSTAVMWHLSDAAWVLPGVDLGAWIESQRPPPPAAAPEEPAFDWYGLLLHVAEAVGALGVAAAAFVGMGRARRAARRLAVAQAERRTEARAQAALDAALATQAALRFEPLAVDAKVEDRTVRANDVIEVGRLAAWPGIAWALPGSGFTIKVGSTPREATVVPRGSRSSILVLRGTETIDVGPGAPVAVQDGDIVADGRSNEPLVRLRFPETLRRTG